MLWSLNVDAGADEQLSAQRQWFITEIEQASISLGAWAKFKVYQPFIHENMKIRFKRKHEKISHLSVNKRSNKLRMYLFWRNPNFPLT